MIDNTGNGKHGEYPQRAASEQHGEWIKQR